VQVEHEHLKKIICLKVDVHLVIINMWICVLMKLSQLVYGEKIAGLHQAIIIK
jgi:hypothetical protein